MTELKRLFNGIVADRRGLPQDDLCRALGRQRRIDAVFDLSFDSEWAEVMEKLRAIIEAHGVRQTVEVPFAAEIEQVLMNTHADRFLNLDAGRIFPMAPATTITTTDLEWRDFLAESAVAEVAARLDPAS